MPLAPGTQLGPYEILSQIGAGGMGEVYKARDTRLDRIVAVKVSKDPFTERFQREARIIAALNHPNVCTLHDVGPNYLVMEFVEGEIPSGPMPYDEAVSVIRQIAEALAAAHEKGVVHRDLKPGNILVKADGTVKVLDFGLARSTVPEPGSVDETVPLTNSIPLTEAGVAVGTVAYMSPEQAQGKPVDKRADIWAFGVVFYELLTGTRLFKGATLPDTLVAVMTREPDWARVSAKAQPLLRSCLERDPRKRLRDIGDAMALLTGSAAQSPARRPWLAWGATGLVLATLLPVVVRHLREPVPVRESTRFQIPLPEGMNFASQGSVSVSPDGRKVVFGASGPDGVTRLWLRSLDSLEIRPLPGTESSDAPLPFWSPDSQTLAVYTGTKLRRLDLAGGSMRDICELGYLGFGGDWNREDLLLVGGGVGGIKRVPATGGAPVELTVPDPSRQDLHHEMPFFLPDQRRFLYFRHSITPGNSGVYLGSVDAKPEEQRREPVLATDLPAVFVPSSDAERGELLFLRDDTLYAQAFDTKRAVLTGDATPVTSVSSLAGGSYGMFSASRTDALVYRAAESRDPSSPGTTGGEPARARWANRDGTGGWPSPAPATRWLSPSKTPRETGTSGGLRRRAPPRGSHLVRPWRPSRCGRPTVLGSPSTRRATVPRVCIRSFPQGDARNF